MQQMDPATTELGATKANVSPSISSAFSRSESFDTGRSPLRFALQSAGIVVLALGLANCSSATQKVSSAKIDPKYGVAPSPRVVADGKPVPKGGGRDHTGKPYQVAGKTYIPKLNEKYTATGTASWYGADFHGRLTANGEVFDKHSIAAAHPTLPLPSYVRVTNLANNRSMVVRVNDRGPFHGGRIIDVSRSVADALDFRRAGTAQVKVEYVGRASLRGSDDRKLLATLQIDGRPAVGGAPTVPVATPVMVASAEPAQPAPPVAAPSMAYAPAAAAPAPVATAASRAIPMPVPRPDFGQQGVAVASAPPAPAVHLQRAEVATIDDLIDLNTIPNAGVPVAVAVPPAGKPVVASLFYAAPQNANARFAAETPFALVKEQRFVSFRKGTAAN
ncbi:hypothetical protein AVW15_00195 [Chelatococcus daeguensis]|nr:hypothetical protein AVW15_00195 [Chelatococcus daeguensis]